MKTIKTQSNSILAIEVPENEHISIDLNYDAGELLVNDVFVGTFELGDALDVLGKLSQLEDEEFERFVEHSKKSLTNENTWRDYRFDEWEECFDVKESFISLLQSNGMDTSKELLIIEIL